MPPMRTPRSARHRGEPHPDGGAVRRGACGGADAGEASCGAATSQAPCATLTAFLLYGGGARASRAAGAMRGARGPAPARPRRSPARPRARARRLALSTPPDAEALAVRDQAAPWPPRRDHRPRAIAVASDPLNPRCGQGPGGRGPQPRRLRRHRRRGAIRSRQGRHRRRHQGRERRLRRRPRRPPGPDRRRRQGPRRRHGRLAGARRRRASTATARCARSRRGRAGEGAWGLRMAAKVVVRKARAPATTLGGPGAGAKLSLAG